MKTETPDPLLSAVLDDDAVFRRITLEQTIALARRRRRAHVVGRAVGMTVVLIAALLLLRSREPVALPTPLAETSALRVIHSEPLAMHESVRTRSGLFAGIASSPTNLAPVSSDANALVRIETRTSAPMLSYLDDRQLLAAFPGEHPALIAPGTAEARLVFAQ